MAIAAMKQGVEYDTARKKHVVVLILEADEAENVAYSLGSFDAAAPMILDLARRARLLDL